MDMVQVVILYYHSIHYCKDCKYFLVFVCMCVYTGAHVDICIGVSTEQGVDI